MSQLDFTKIIWAGDNSCILVTARDHAKEPVLILTGQDVKRLILEFESKEEEKWKHQSIRYSREYRKNEKER